MHPSEKIHRLVDALGSAPVSEHQEEVERTLADARSLADHNEWGIALELLCDNLYEYELVLSSEQYKEIERLANSWGIAHSYVDPLKTLIVGESAA